MISHEIEMLLRDVIGAARLSRYSPSKESMLDYFYSVTSFYLSYLLSKGGLEDFIREKNQIAQRLREMQVNKEIINYNIIVMEKRLDYFVINIFPDADTNFRIVLNIYKGVKTKAEWDSAYTKLCTTWKVV